MNVHVCCGYSLEAPQPGSSNEYPRHTNVWAAPFENVSSDIRDSEGSDRPAHPQTESLDTTEGMNGEQSSGPSCSKRC